MKFEQFLITSCLVLLLFVFGSIFSWAVFDTSSGSLVGDDVSSESSTSTLTIRRPPVAVTGPRVDGSSDRDEQAFRMRFYDKREQEQLASRYVFVRGFVKSGTSWTKMLVALHNQVHMLPYGE